MIKMKKIPLKQQMEWEKLVGNKDFERLANVIKEIDLDEDAATRIVINCCNTCFKHKTLKKWSKNTFTSLVKLLDLVVKKVVIFSKVNTEKFLQSIYHIVNYLLSQDQMELVLDMEEIFIPQCLCKNVKDNQKNIQSYKALCSILYKNFHENSKNSKNINSDSKLVNLYGLIITISGKFLGPSLLLEYSLSCARLLQTTNTKVRTNPYFMVIIQLKENILSINDTNLADTAYLLCYTLYKLLDKSGFKEAETFFNDSKAALNMSKEFTDIHNVLQIFLYLFPVDYKEKYLDLDRWKIILQNYAESHKNLKIFDKIGDLVRKLLHVLTNFYNKETITLSEKTILRLLDCVKMLSSHTKCTYSCKCGCHSYHSECDLSLYMLGPIRYFIDYKNGTVSTDFLVYIRNFLTNLADLLGSLKKNNCSECENFYDQWAHYFHNMSVIVSKKSDNIENCMFYKQYLIDAFKFDYDGSVKDIKITNVMKIIAENLRKNKQYKEALFYTALYGFISPSIDSINMWGVIKSQNKSTDDILNLTLLSALNQYKDFLPILQDYIKISQENKVALLSLELNYYKMKWPSKQPIYSAFKQFCQIADIESTSKIVIEIFGDGCMNVLDDIHKIFNSVRNACYMHLKKSPNSNNVKLCIAVLNFYLFKRQITLSTVKNTEEMEQSMAVINQEDLGNPVPKDASENSEIVPTYEDLTLSKYMDTIDYLNNSLSLLQSLEITHEQQSYTPIIASLLLNIAFECRLHYLGLKYLQAIDLCLKYSSMGQDRYKMLICVTSILDNATPSKKIIRNGKSLVDLGDDLATVLINETKSGENDKHTNSLKAVIAYYVSKSKYLLATPEKAYECFKLAEKLYEEQKCKEDFACVKMQLMCLEYYFHLPCRKKFEHLQYSVMLSLHLAYEATLTYNGPNDAYEKSVMFDTMQELTKAYHLSRSPREVTRYTLNVLLCTQKMVLPLRSAYLLLYLSHADLFRNSLSGCLVKLQGLNDILSLNNIKPMNNAVCDISKTLKDLKLDSDNLKVKSTEFQRQLSPGSPVVQVQRSKDPAFFTHGESCNCFYCNSLEFHQLVLEKTRLEAIVNAREKQNVLAKHFFTDAVKFYTILSEMYVAFQNRNSKHIDADLIPKFKDYFTESFGYILLNYSNYLAGQNKIDEAHLLTNKLISLLTPRKSKHIYLYDEALMQALSYFIFKKRQEEIVTVKEESEENHLVPLPKGGGDVTPESKLSHVALPQTSPFDMPLPVRLIKKPKKIDFDSPSVKSEPKDNCAIVTPCKSKVKSSILTEFNSISTKKKPTRNVTASSVKSTPNIRIFTDKDVPSVSKSRIKTNLHAENFEIPQKVAPRVKMNLQKVLDASSEDLIGRAKESVKSKTKLEINLLNLPSCSKSIDSNSSSEDSTCPNDKPTESKASMTNDKKSSRTNGLKTTECASVKCKKEEAKYESEESSSEIIPMSPEASIVATVVASALKSRTKKLTEKLKQSARKEEVKVTEEKRSRAPRKNLFGDLEGVGKTPEVRKSARNKKCV